MSNQLERSFQIIEYISENGPLDIEDINKKTKIPRSTIFKLLCSLEKIGYAYKSSTIEQTNYWYLTLKFLKISRLILSRVDLKDEIKDISIKLSKDVNEIVQIGVLYNKKVMYIDVIKRPNSIISYAGVGAEVSINTSAAGMVLAASLEESELDELLKNSNFKRNTIYTITDIFEMKKELSKIMVDGFAFDNQMYAIGIRCLAAPVYNFEGKVVAAINITGHISTMPDEKIELIKNKLLDAAGAASVKMGYNGKLKNRKI